MTVVSFGVLLAKIVHINQIAFCGGVSYRCFRSASIISASRLPSLLVTRGFREHAHVVPYFSHIVPLLCGVSAFVDAAAPEDAEGGGARPPHPGSWRWNRRLRGSVRGRRCGFARTCSFADGDCFAVAVTYSDSLSVAYSESRPIPDPESYAVADSDDAGPDIAASVTAFHAGV